MLSKLRLKRRVSPRKTQVVQIKTSSRVIRVEQNKADDLPPLEGNTSGEWEGTPNSDDASSDTTTADSSRFGSIKLEEFLDPEESAPMSQEEVIADLKETQARKVRQLEREIEQLQESLSEAMSENPEMLEITQHNAMEYQKRLRKETSKIQQEQAQHFAEQMAHQRIEYERVDKQHNNKAKQLMSIK